MELSSGHWFVSNVSPILSRPIEMNEHDVIFVLCLDISFEIVDLFFLLVI